MDQGFEAFISILDYTMRHGLVLALFWFHTKIGTFHQSYGEYGILLLDWTAILGIKFGDEPFLNEHVSIEEACALLDFTYPFPAKMFNFLGRS